MIVLKFMKVWGETMYWKLFLNVNGETVSYVIESDVSFIWRLFEDDIDTARMKLVTGKSLFIHVKDILLIEEVKE